MPTRRTGNSWYRPKTTIIGSTGFLAVSLFPTIFNQPAITSDHDYMKLNRLRIAVWRARKKTIERFHVTNQDITHAVLIGNGPLSTLQPPNNFYTHFLDLVRRNVANLIQ